MQSCGLAVFQLSWISQVILGTRFIFNDKNPIGNIMTAHKFATILYVIEDTLGLWCNARKKEQIQKSEYDGHRQHYHEVGLSRSDIDNRLSRMKAIFKRLHIGSNVPQTMRDNHLNILENVYNFLSRQCIHLASRTNDPIQFHIDWILLPIICVDIAIFKNGANENAIYFHLDRILGIEALIKRKDGVEVLDKTIAKRYAKKYIGELFQAVHNQASSYDTPQAIIPSILSYLDEFSKKWNQTCVTLHQRIKMDRELKNENAESREIINTIIDKIEAAYTAIIILQDIDNKTNNLGQILRLYNNFYSPYQKEDGNLFGLLSCMNSALITNFHELFESEFKVCVINGIRPELFLDKKKYYLVKNICANIFKLMSNHFKTYAITNLIKLSLIEEDYLSKMVSLPPEIEPPMICSDAQIYTKYLDKAKECNIYVFNKSNFSCIYDMARYRVNDDELTTNDAEYFGQYIPLIEALDYIKHGDATSALREINTVPVVKFQLFGFVKYALAVLHIGLMYNLNKKIGNKHLMPKINDIINHQGLVAIPIILPSYVIQPDNMKCREAWMSEDEYFKASIIFGANTYNYILSQAIYCYNFTVARHTVTKDVFADSKNANISRVNLLKLNYSSPLIIHNLLDKLNDISGRILNGLDKVSVNVAPDVFAMDLFNQNIITEAELTESLIRGINDSSLSLCLLDHLTIILLFSVPGDNVKSIVELGKNTRVVELLFLAYKYHKTLGKISQKQ